jgi:hypothetical protein
VEWKPHEGNFQWLERDSQWQKGVPLLSCSFGPHPEQATGDKGRVVPQVLVQHQGYDF